MVFIPPLLLHQTHRTVTVAHIFGWDRHEDLQTLFFAKRFWISYLEMFHLTAMLASIALFVYFIVFRTIFYYYCCILEIKYSRIKYRNTYSFSSSQLYLFNFRKNYLTMWISLWLLELKIKSILCLCGWVDWLCEMYAANSMSA